MGTAQATSPEDDGDQPVGDRGVGPLGWGGVLLQSNRGLQLQCGLAGRALLTGDSSSSIVILQSQTQGKLTDNEQS